MLNAGFKKKEDGLREELAAAGDAAATARDAAEAAAARLTSAEEVRCRRRRFLINVPRSDGGAGALCSLWQGACVLVSPLDGDHVWRPEKPG